MRENRKKEGRKKAAGIERYFRILNIRDLIPYGSGSTQAWTSSVHTS